MHTSVEQDGLGSVAVNLSLSGLRQEVSDLIPERIRSGGALSEVEHSWTISGSSSERVTVWNKKKGEADRRLVNTHRHMRGELGRY